MHRRLLHSIQAHSWYKPNSTKSLLSQVFLLMPRSLTTLTSKLLHAETQHHDPFTPHDQTTRICSVNLMCSIPNRLLSSTVLLFKWTPHIFPTIFHSIFSHIAISSTFMAQVSLAYLMTLWIIQAPYTFPSLSEKFSLTSTLEQVPWTLLRHNVLLPTLLFLHYCTSYVMSLK